jgi:hypothetical protein
MFVPIAFVSPGSEGFGERIGLFAYGLPLGVLTVISMLPLTDDHAAAWVIRMSPREQFGPLWAGAVRATLTRFVFLPCLGFGILASVFGGIQGAITAAAASAIAVFVAASVARIVKAGIPYSKAFKKDGQTELMGVYLLLIFVLIGCGALHRGVAGRFVIELSVFVVFAILGAVQFAALRRADVRPHAQLPIRAAAPGSEL